MSEGAQVDGADWAVLSGCGPRSWPRRRPTSGPSTSGGVHSVVWFALLVGAAMAVALPILFGGPSRPRTF